MTATPGFLFTDRAHGDLAPTTEPHALEARRAAIRDLPWTWLTQVHGATVVTASRPGEHAGAAADAAVTAVPGVVLAIQAADCPPVLLVADHAIGVAHAGWRGLAAGIIEATAAAMAALGATPDRAVLGPCIRSRCYEFGTTDLDRVAERLGDGVRATTAWGTSALDLTAAVGAACDAAGLTLADSGICTACSPVHWSHRARADASRQALVAWMS